MITERPFDDAAQMSITLASDIAAALRAAIAARGKASFVATGGTTPAALYAALATREIAWSQVAITLSDERWVAPTDAASNEALLRRTLLVGPAAAATFVPLKTDAAHPADAVTAVDAALREIARPFDVVLLGMGADGHIASLFPGAVGYESGMAAREGVRLVAAIRAAGAAGAADRLSLTLGALLGARRIVVMFTGAEKLDVYRRARNGAGDAPIAALLEQTRCPVEVCWSLEGV